MTPLMYVAAGWIVLSAVFVGVGVWWSNRKPPTFDALKRERLSHELATVTVLYPPTERDVQGTTQNPPRSAA